jgi:hypothetical protein
MAIGDPSTRGDQAGRGCSDLLEGAMSGNKTRAGNATRVDHPRLKLGEFGQRGFDTLLDGTNLRRDFVCGVLNLMLTHVTAPFRATRIAQTWLPK